MLAPPPACAFAWFGPALFGLALLGQVFKALILWLPLIHGLRLALEPGVQLSLCAALASGWMWACYEDAGSGATPGLGILVVLGAAATLVLEPYTQDVPRREWLSAIAKDGAGPRIARRSMKLLSNSIARETVSET